MVQLTITLDDAGQLSISGPIENKILCYGILEAAKDALALKHAQGTRLVVPAVGVPVRTPKGD